ncbi:MAG: HEAT repeat domain-containing protein [Bryobacteraceae bacterium]
MHIEWDWKKRPIFRDMLADRLLQPSDPRDLSVLKGMLANCTKISAVTAAGKLLDEGFAKVADNAILCALSSPTADVRVQAARLASQNHLLWPALVDKLDDSEPTVQLAALKAIKELGEKRKFEAVEQRYRRTRYSTVSLAAAKTLKSLDQKRAQQVFEKAVAAKAGYVTIYGAAMLLTINRKK